MVCCRKQITVKIYTPSSNQRQLGEREMPKTLYGLPVPNFFGGMASISEI